MRRQSHSIYLRHEPQWMDLVDELEMAYQTHSFTLLAESTPNAQTPRGATAQDAHAHHTTRMQPE